MSWRSLRRVPLVAVGLTLPSAAVLTSLHVAGRLDLAPTLIAVAVILVLMAIAATPFVRPLAVLPDAIEMIGPGAGPGPGAEAAAARASRP